MPPGVRDESSGGTKCITVRWRGVEGRGTYGSTLYPPPPCPRAVRAAPRVCIIANTSPRKIPARSSTVSLHSRLSLSRHTTHAGVTLFFFYLFFLPQLYAQREAYRALESHLRHPAAIDQLAYFLVHSLAVASYFALSVL